jgi:hypothetical protein
MIMVLMSHEDQTSKPEGLLHLTVPFLRIGDHRPSHLPIAAGIDDNPALPIADLEYRESHIYGVGRRPLQSVSSRPTPLSIGDKT